jgi:hypothetical protein
MIGEAPATIEPMRVTATLSGGLAMNHRPMLDGVLAAVYAYRERLQIPRGLAELVPIRVPLAMSDCDRYAMCSEAQLEIEERELRYKQRRPIVEQLARFAPKARRVQITAGPNKAYRIPYALNLLTGDSLHWFALGDRAMVLALLREVFSLGKHRGSGKGLVSSWDVDECEPWDGFPALRDGVPLRPLPHDLVRGGRLEYRVLAPPYWMREREELCAVA